MLKYAAMFGLDARIALAIFGALSVISGAALYSAIQDSKATSFYMNVVEFEKGIEALILDTGGLTITGSSVRSPNLKDVYKDQTSRVGWDGPYMPTYSYYSTRSSSVKDANGIVIGMVLDRISFGGCSGGSYGSTGNHYLHISEDKNDDASQGCDTDVKFLKYVHDKFDNDGDYSSGKLIVSPDAGNPEDGMLLYKLPKSMIN